MIIFEVGLAVDAETLSRRIRDLFGDGSVARDRFSVESKTGAVVATEARDRVGAEPAADAVADVAETLGRAGRERGPFSVATI